MSIKYNSPFKAGNLHWQPSDVELQDIAAFADRAKIHQNGWAELNRISNIRMARRLAMPYTNLGLDERLHRYKSKKAAALARDKHDQKMEIRKQKAAATRKANAQKKLEKQLETHWEKPRIRVKAISVPFYYPDQIWTPERQYYENNV
jgi:hypothetical protein